MEKEIKVYDEIYQKGKYLKWPDELVVSLINRLFAKDHREKIKILDLGCGGGNNTLFLSIEGFQTYAVDGSSNSIEITKKRLKDKNLTVDCKIANFKNLPYENDFFDCVLDRGSIYANEWDDIQIIYKEVYRILKKQGIYLGFLPHRSSSKYAHFFSEEDIKFALKNFQIEDILKETLESVYRKENPIIDGKRYILVARK